jgi:glycosyltransferase involved in cell wall biosynthesis
MNETTLPLVSIIIPYFNHGDFILEALESIIHQNYLNLEIIVIDDCSTMKLAKEVLSDYSSLKLTLIQTNSNSGPSIARNLGLAVAKGKYILPLDGDDKLGEPFLLEAVNQLERSDNLMVVYGNGQKFGSNNETIILPDFVKFEFLNYNPLFVTALIRKTAIEAVGGYDPYLSKLGLEDWDLWLSFGEMEFTFKKMNKCFLHIRVLDNSRTFTVANKNLETIFEHIYKKHWKILLKSFEIILAEKNDLSKSREYLLGKNLLNPIRKLYSFFKI